MPVKDQAAYMREYRARKKAHTGGPGEIVGVITPAVGEPITFAGTPSEVIATLSDRILTLTEEVAQLKRVLATRAERQPGTFPFTREELGLGTSAILPYQRDPIRDPMREFRPAPKSGKGK